MDNAWRLKGNLLMMVGGLDANVDPSSTLQANALIPESTALVFPIAY